MRALSLIRLSRVTDATTSPERQRENNERFCKANGYTIVGEAEDLDVGGSTDPLARTGSGPWLRDRLAEFDVIVAQKLDRFGRSTRHVHGLFQYVNEHGKSLRSADGQIDTAGPAGELILFILAWAAQMELAAIRERNTNAAQYNLKAGKYRGGVVPAGYRSVKLNGKGHGFAPDECDHVGEPGHEGPHECDSPGMAPVIREVVARVLAGHRRTAIVKDLNDRGVMTAKDRQAVLNGREPSGLQWSVSNLKRLLISPTLIGQVTHREPELDSAGRAVRNAAGGKVYGPDKILYGEDGLPVRRSEPLISESDYHALQGIITREAEDNRQSPRRADTGLLIQVLFCGVCGRPMWRLKGGPGRKDRYRCASATNGPCGNRSVTIEEADNALESLLVSLIGTLPFMEKHYFGGIDHTREIEEIDAQLMSISDGLLYVSKGSPAHSRVVEQIRTLSARRDELAALPSEEAGYRYIPTMDDCGQPVTFRDRWEGMPPAERNDYLRANGVRATFQKLGQRDKPRWSVEFNEMEKMFDGILPDAGQDLFEHMAQGLADHPNMTYYAAEDRKPGEPLESWLERTQKATEE